MDIHSISAAGGSMMVSRSFAVSQMKGDFSSGGLFTNSDIAMIKAATNTEFNWPPAAGEGAPLAAFELSMVRLCHMQQGSVIADVTAKDLTAAASWPD